MEAPNALPKESYELSVTAMGLRIIKLTRSRGLWGKMNRALEVHQKKSSTVIKIKKAKGHYSIWRNNQSINLNDIGKIIEATHKPTNVKLIELTEPALIDSMRHKGLPAKIGDFIVISGRGEIYAIDREVAKNDYDWK